MNFIDLSHVINGQIPVYPGKDKPTLKKTTSILVEGYRETELLIETHLGTHIDAPAHMFEDGRFLNQYPVSRFAGIALIIKVPEGENIISISFLKRFENEMESVDFVLFNTCWGRFWGTEKYFHGFPILDEEGANWLASFFIKGVGFDTISVDPVEAKRWDNHYLFFNQDIIIIENLIFPENLEDIFGEFYCFPLSIEEADGSPVRAVFRIK
jgi:arylformamidase